MKRVAFTIVLIVGVTLGGVGSIVFAFSTPLGISLIIIATLIAAASIIQEDHSQRDSLALADMQARLMASKGVGNVYYGIYRKEIEEKRKSPRGTEYLLKAHSLEPNNLDIMRDLSVALAMNLSYAGIAGKTNIATSDSRWRMANSLADKVIAKKSKEWLARDAKGILCDIAGKHEEARKWFTESSKYRTDPYWHHLKAMSWLESGKPNKAIEEMEAAIAEGANDWFTDSYYGQALWAVKRYLDALPRLNKARRAKGPDFGIAGRRATAYAALGMLSLSVILDGLYLFFAHVLQSRRLAAFFGVNRPPFRNKSAGLSE